MRFLLLFVVVASATAASVPDRIARVNGEIFQKLQFKPVNEFKPIYLDVDASSEKVVKTNIDFSSFLAVHPDAPSQDEQLTARIAKIHDELALKIAAHSTEKKEQEISVPEFVPTEPKMEFEKIEAKPAPAVPSELASYSYAVDFSSPASLSQFQCIRNAGYGAAFVRAYNPAGNGAFDSNAPTNINNAYSAGLGIEIYMTPQPKSTKAGYQQVDEISSGLNAKGITIRSLWIQVTSPVNWGSTINTNINFINSAISRARQYGWSVGIYTAQYDWNQITNGWTGVGNDVMLWYWNVNGGGPSGETPANFNDFHSFGCWTAPTVKQFGQVESVCSLTVNRDVYLSGSTMKQAPVEGMAKYEAEFSKPNVAVGGIGLH